MVNVTAPLPDFAALVVWGMAQIIQFPGMTSANRYIGGNFGDLKKDETFRKYFSFPRPNHGVLSVS